MKINYCFQCGTEVISEDDSFCRACGVKLEGLEGERKEVDGADRPSRRQFLKATAGGAAGLGAFGLLSRHASAQYEIRTDRHVITGTLTAGRIRNRISDAELQAAWDGLITPVAPGLGPDDAS